MVKSQRDNRKESEFAQFLRSERIPLSGASDGSFSDNVQGQGITWEIKARRDGFKMLHGWLENANALALRADKREWLVCVQLVDCRNC